jgi:hypothetical protein
MIEKRRLEPIIRDGKLAEWKCSHCSWKKPADDTHGATATTISLFSEHRCAENAMKSGSRSKSDEAFSTLDFVLAFQS